ncbi:MAG: HEAT repeat domain-containing protein [Promethearchaeota archaeon]|jgi:DNA repair exonuclease SbcCD ATPase subunit
MGKDLKDVINTVEEETKSLSELEATVNSLKEEINRLKSTIKEQDDLIDEQSVSISTEKMNLTSETDILKDIIISQRQDLVRKDEANENLNEKIERLTNQLDTIRGGTINGQKSNDLIEAQELILNLSDENEEYRNMVDDLKKQLEHINLEKTEVRESSQIHAGDAEDVINLKKLNFHLMEENGLLRVEIESLKSKMHNQINEPTTEELDLAIEKINVLTSEVEDYEAQVSYLRQQLEETQEPAIISTEEALEFTKIREEYEEIKTEIIKIQEENQRLNSTLIELNHAQVNQPKINEEIYPVVFNFPREFQTSLFKKMYDLLDYDNRRSIVDNLIENLNSRNNDVKRVTLKILCEIKDSKVYDAFFTLLHDKDWVIRYNIIKALTNFGFDTEEFKSSLEELSTDSDIDVRELAVKVLDEFSR